MNEIDLEIFNCNRSSPATKSRQRNRIRRIISWSRKLSKEAWGQRRVRLTCAPNWSAFRINGNFSGFAFNRSQDSVRSLFKPFIIGGTILMDFLIAQSFLRENFSSKHSGTEKIMLKVMNEQDNLKLNLGGFSKDARPLSLLIEV